MVSNKQKKANLKKGLLGKSTGETTPIIEQINNVIRIEPELDNSREAKKKRKAVADEQRQQTTKKK